VKRDLFLRDEVLVEPWEMRFDYRRTTGPIVGHFLSGLREKRFYGLRTKDGQVVVPPTGYDPKSSEDSADWVEVGPSGVVVSWTWVSTPLPSHPVDFPFAWALIQLQGADTSLVHWIEVDSEGDMRTGMRVMPKWAENRSGHIWDIRSFIPDPVVIAESS